MNLRRCLPIAVVLLLFSACSTLTTLEDPIITSQGVLVGDVVITSQEDVRALRGVTKIDGNLTITGSNVLDFKSMNVLREVTGSFRIDFLNQQSMIDGFKNLKVVGQEFVIARSDALTGIAGFRNLESVGWTFSISFNPALASIGSFESLRSV